MIWSERAEDSGRIYVKYSLCIFVMRGKRSEMRSMLGKNNTVKKGVLMRTLINLSVNLLPLMMEFEIVDIMFLVKSVKFPSAHFNIHEFVQFCSYSTRAGHSFKLKHLLCRSNYERNFYFNRIPRLWNSLPFLDITLSPSVIKSKLRAYFWDHFMSTFNSNNLCTYHYLCPCPKCSQLPVKMHFNVSL